MLSATGSSPRLVKSIPDDVTLFIRSSLGALASHKVSESKGQGNDNDMPTELDQRYDAVLAAVTGPGGRLVVGEDAQGRREVTNFPATLPGFFKTFCALNGAVEAIIAGEERLTFADLDRISDEVARALVARHGIAKGDRVGIAMRNCPSWIVAHMAILKAGGISTLLNGWWQSGE